MSNPRQPKPPGSLHLFRFRPDQWQVFYDEATSWIKMATVGSFLPKTAVPPRRFPPIGSEPIILLVPAVGVE